MYRISQPRHTMESQTAQTSFKSLLCRLHKPKIDHTCIILSFTASENLGVPKSLENAQLCLNWSLFLARIPRASTPPRQQVPNEVQKNKCVNERVAEGISPNACSAVFNLCSPFQLANMFYILWLLLYMINMSKSIVENTQMWVRRCFSKQSSQFSEGVGSPVSPSPLKASTLQGRSAPPARSQSEWVHSELSHGVAALPFMWQFRPAWSPLAFVQTCLSCALSHRTKLPMSTIFPLYMARSCTLHECSFLSSGMWKHEYYCKISKVTLLSVIIILKL